MQLETVSDAQKYENLVIQNLFVLEKYAGQKVRQLSRCGIMNLNKSEIISIGYEGLYKAAVTYDVTKNNNFQGYAWYQIDLAFKTYQRKIDGIHHVTRAQIKKINQKAEALTQNLGRHPTDSEIADSLDIDVNEVRKYKNIESDYIQSIQDTNEDYSPIDEENWADKDLDENERKSNLGKDMNDCLQSSLSEEQRKIIELMYLENKKADEIALTIWGRFEKKEKYLIYNTTKSSKLRLKNCMEKKGWSITDV